MIKGGLTRRQYSYITKKTTLDTRYNEHRVRYCREFNIKIFNYFKSKTF